MRKLIKNCLLVITTALLFGCAMSKLENVQKVDALVRPIDGMALIILEPDAASEKSTGAASGRAASAVAEARDSVDLHLKDRLPAIFAAAGVPTTLADIRKLDLNTIGNVVAGQTRISHVLTLQRVRASSFCGPYSCQSNVHLTASLFDTASKKTAWSSLVFVGEKTAHHKIGAENIEELAGKLLTQLKSDGFIK